MARIIIKNDGKEKSQSFEAHLEPDISFNEGNVYINNLDISNLIGYGENKEEALQGLALGLDYIMQELESIMDEINWGTIKIEEKDKGD